MHIATHGFYLEKKTDDQSGAAATTRGLELETSGAAVPEREPADPLVRSALALSGANGGDGVVSALELSAIDLAGTKLVVLSACETGLGDVRSGEGVFGLRRALSIAGAETQVISLWQVDDRGTQTMMTGYYKKLREGRGRSDAMREVRHVMLKQGKTEHPYFWASFLVFGESTPLDGFAPLPAAAPSDPKAAAPPKLAPSARGCGCETSASDTPPAAIAALLALAVARRRRRARVK